MSRMDNRICSTSHQPQSHRQVSIQHGRSTPRSTHPRNPWLQIKLLIRIYTSRQLPTYHSIQTSNNIRDTLNLILNQRLLTPKTINSNQRIWRRKRIFTFCTPPPIQKNLIPSLSILCTETRQLNNVPARASARAHQTPSHFFPSSSNPFAPFGRLNLRSDHHYILFRTLRRFQNQIHSRKSSTILFGKI